MNCNPNLVVLYLIPAISIRRESVYRIAGTRDLGRSALHSCFSTSFLPPIPVTATPRLLPKASSSLVDDSRPSDAVVRRGNQLLKRLELPKRVVFSLEESSKAL